MVTNPVEENVVTRTILGLAVVFSMMVVGGAVASVLRTLEVPYGAWVGVAIGILTVWVAFVVLYRRYDAAHD